MAKQQTLLQILVASPGDVAEERKILEDVMNEFNLTWADSHKVRLELVKWETHTRPGFGEDAQDVINKQIGDQYDIFLGIMWGRFGSPTSRAESGTEEEFERAYSRLKTSPENIQIMFYFKDAAIPPSKIDPTQLAKVQEFQRKIATEYGGLYHRFGSTEEFRTKSRIHLSMLVQDWRKTLSTTGGGTTKTTTLAPAGDTVDPLANLSALTDDDFDDGIIELSERASEAMGAVVAIVEKMSDATKELVAKFAERTKEVKQLTSGGSTPNIKAAKRVSNSLASDLEVYVNRLSVEIPEFHKQHSVAMDTFGKIAIISDTDLEEDPEDIKTALAQIHDYRNGISRSSESLREFRATIARLPRMTSAFNRARRRTTAIIDDLLVQLRSAENQIQDVEQLLERMLDTKDEGSS